jgi:hypothetical protein
MIVGTTPMIAIPGAAFMRPVAMIVGPAPQIRCNEFGHGYPMIAIPAADDCGLLHLPWQNPEPCIRRRAYVSEMAFPRVRTPPLRPPSLPLALVGEQWGGSACSDHWEGGCDVRVRCARRLAAREFYAPEARSSWGAAGWVGRALASEPAGGVAPQEAVRWTRGIGNGGLLEKLYNSVKELGLGVGRISRKKSTDCVSVAFLKPRGIVPDTPFDAFRMPRISVPDTPPPRRNP